MAWRIEKAGQCPDCGTSRWEWDPKHGGHRQAYQTETWLCPVCMQGETVHKDIHKEGGTGKKLNIKPTKFHPTRGMRLSRGARL